MNKVAEELIERLLADSRFDSFFQIVYLLESFAPEIDFEGKLEVADQIVRFRAAADLTFPVSEIESFKRKYDDKQSFLCLTVNFLGLYGPSSPLPAFYTEDILVSPNLEESNRREFLDLFHQRLFYLLYRVWKKYRYYILYEQGAKDPFSRWLFSLIGLGEPLEQLRNLGHVQWERLLSYVGLLSMRSRSAAILENILSHYFFEVPVTVKQCLTQWVTIEEWQRNRLGIENCELGKTLSLGEKVLDRSGKFRVAVGPLSLYKKSRKTATFCEFLPTGRHYHTIRELIKFFLVDQLDFEIMLILEEDYMPKSLPGPAKPSDRVYLKLGGNPWEDKLCCLGWSTWLGYYDAGNGEVSFPGR